MATNRRSLQDRDIEAGGIEHDTEIDKWAGSLAKILEDVPQYMCSRGHPGRITRIPENLREIDPKAYEPYFVSIGPYHHDKPSVQLMERRKWKVLKYFLQANREVTLKEYLNEFRSTEKEVRTFYSDVKMESQKFVLMLLLDTIFVLSLFCGMPECPERRNQTNFRTGNGEDKDDNNDWLNHSSEDDNENMPLLPRVDELDELTANEEEAAPRMYSALFTHDLFLLENQLPFFVLEKIFVVAYHGSKPQLTKIMKDAIGNILLDYAKLNSEYVFSATEDVYHLLHICHMFFRPTLQQECAAPQLHESNEMFRLGSAVQLYEAGVSFVARPSSTRHSLLDITFSSSGKMVMPCLPVDDNTNSLLRNLIALEQMKYPKLGLNVSAYAVLLLHLVTTPEDAQLLRRKAIIDHHLASDKDMMYLVNKLSIGLSFDYTEDNYSLKPVFQELKRYTEHRVPRWQAWLKHRYFNNPWTTISLVAASILLLLTIVQTYYAVYSYYVPCSGCHS